MCADLKKIYGAINLDDAEYAKEEFREKWDKKYPNILKSWDKNWAELTAFFDISNISCRTVGDQENNIYNKRCGKLPQNGEKIYKIKSDFSYR